MLVEREPAFQSGDSGSCTHTSAPRVPLTKSRRCGLWWVVWARYAGHVLVVLPLAWSKAGSGFWRTGQPLLQLGRSTLLLVATIAFFSGLRYLPLAEATAIMFATPLLVVLLSGPVLGERARESAEVASGGVRGHRVRVGWISRPRAGARGRQGTEATFVPWRERRNHLATSFQMHET